MHTPSSLLENALNATASHVAVLDGDGVIRYANQAWSSFCLLNGGSEASCGVGANYLTTCEMACGEHAKEASEVISGIRSVLNGRQTEFRCDYPCHSPLEQRWFQLRACGFQHQGAMHAIVIHENVTDLKLQEQKIQFCHQRFHDVASAAGEYIWEIDPAGKFTYLSEMITPITGYTPEELLGACVFDLMPPEESRKTRAAYQKLAEERAGFRNRINRIAAKNGSEVILQTSGVPIVGQNNELLGYRGANMDITEHRRALEKIERLAHYDTLTGLPNRIKTFDLIDQALTGVTADSFSTIGIFSVDIDFFNTINESLGHDAGNCFLVQTARRLEQVIDTRGSISRFGNDKFIVIIETLEEWEYLADLGHRMLAAAADPVMHNGQEICLTASIGIACAPQDSLERNELLGFADMALRLARLQGRNQAAFFRPELAERSRTLLNMEGRLRRALDRGDFCMVYQPQYHAKSGAIIGMEALLRWHDPDLGQVSPAEFIPLAEERGMIVPIGEWVFEQVCHQIRQWDAAGLLKVPVAVNISPMQFRYPGFLKHLKRQYSSCCSNLGLLELEITESCLLDNGDNRARDLLRELKEMGFKLSVDDFGTGYSSLSNLQHLPIDRLKVDRSFVAGLPDNSGAVGLVSAIIAMGKALELELIAEGVETREQLIFLTTLNCLQIQGYYFSRPLAAQDMTSLLKT
jgi:diguanylate cyclase (GGDEF)-like protein/PAS domain S-box-containing protein